MKLTMNNHGDAVSAAGLGTVVGLFVHYAALIPSISPVIVQAIVTIIVGGATVAINHFVKRWLDRRWPDRKRRAGDTAE